MAVRSVSVDTPVTSSCVAGEDAKVLRRADEGFTSEFSASVVGLSGTSTEGVASGAVETSEFLLSPRLCSPFPDSDGAVGLDAALLVPSILGPVLGNAWNLVSLSFLSG